MPRKPRKPKSVQVEYRPPTPEERLAAIEKAEARVIEQEAVLAEARERCRVAKAELRERGKDLKLAIKGEVQRPLFEQRSNAAPTPDPEPSTPAETDEHRPEAHKPGIARILAAGE